MATDVKDVGETLGNALGKIAREAAQSMSSNGHGSSPLSNLSKANGPLSGPRGVAAGAALAAAPFAASGAGKMLKRAVAKKLAPSKGNGVGSVGEKMKDGVKGSVGKAGAVGQAVKDKVPGKGGDSADDQKGTPGVGKGRRMPVQQAVDVAVPLSTAYNQWTQFEEWPQFMHRLDQATQEDDCNVSFKTKIWGISKEFEAQILEQRPDERIQWTVTQGVTHNGVVTFHELADRLTRVEVSLDVEPGSLLEKAARGMRHVKRAVRSDLARYKAFIEMQEKETGAWRGVIHDGNIVKQKGKGGSSGGRKRKSSSGKAKPSKSARRSSSGRKSKPTAKSSGRKAKSSGRSSSRSKSKSGSKSR